VSFSFPHRRHKSSTTPIPQLVHRLDGTVLAQMRCSAVGALLMGVYSPANTIVLSYHRAELRRHFTPRVRWLSCSGCGRTPPTGPHKSWRQLCIYPRFAR